MRNNRKMINNMVFSGFFQLFYLILPVITIPYVARVFSAEQLGFYATTLATVTILKEISSFGIPLYGMREIAQSKTEMEKTRMFFNLWYIQILITIFIFTLFNIAVYLLKGDILWYFQGLLLLSNLFDISWFYIGIEEIKKVLFRSALSKIIALILIFTLVKTSHDMVMYILINIFGVLLGNVTMILQLNRFINISDISLKLNWEHFKESYRLLIPQVIKNMKITFPKVMVGWWSNLQQAGFFDQGMKIIGTINTISSSVVNSMLPRISSLKKDGKEEEIKKIIVTFSFTALVVTTTFINGTLSISDYFVPIFFGTGYVEVIPIMKLGSITLIFNLFNFLLGNGVMLAYSKDKEFQRIIILSAAVLLMGCIILIKPLGALGAVLAYLISEILLFLLLLINLKDAININIILKNIIWSPILILMNYFFISALKKMIVFKSEIINFLFFGVVSVLISLVLSLIIFFHKE